MESIAKAMTVEKAINFLYRTIHDNGNLIPQYNERVFGHSGRDTWEFNGVKSFLENDGCTIGIITDNMIVWSTGGNGTDQPARVGWLKGTEQDLFDLVAQFS